ncbi:MAG: biopolymer transporter ExbD [Gammaproteobacteria bacterium]|nr:biopolymer transporter ExbD [Gammaproteobacteria bacterium]
MRRKHFKDDDETAVDMTPMLDIVFIMLIFFIVTTSFVKESGVIVDRPDPNQSQDQPPPKKKNIFIKIDQANRITMDGLDVDIRAVRARVEQKRAQNPEAIAIVGVHTDSETDTLISVVNATRLAGVEKVSVNATEL